MRIESQRPPLYVNSSSDNCIADLIYLICELFTCLFGESKDNTDLSEPPLRPIVSYDRASRVFERRVEDSIESLRRDFASFPSSTNSTPSHEISIDYDQISRAERAFEGEKEAWQNLKELPNRLSMKIEEINREMKESTERLALQTRLHNENIIHGLYNKEIKELNDHIFNEEMKRIQAATKLTMDFFNKRRPSQVFDGLSYEHFKLLYEGDGVWTIGSQIPMTLINELFQIETSSEATLGEFFTQKGVPQKFSDHYAIHRVNRDPKGAVINIEVKGLIEAELMQSQKKRLAELINQMES